MGLQVYEIKFKLYAESQAEADALQAELLAFVRDKREKGIAVTANKLIRALQQFKTNIFVNNYLNQ
jgi:hypothetical protein